MDLPDGFALAAVLEREDPRDAFVSNRYAALAELPQGAVVGTSSLRRVVQLRALRPDLRIEPLRGNLDTRLRKLDEGDYDAIVLAAAGPEAARPGAAHPRALRSRRRCCRRPGRARSASRCAPTTPRCIERLAPLTAPADLARGAAERAVSRALGGSCSMPLAAHAAWRGDAARAARRPRRPATGCDRAAAARRKRRRRGRRRAGAEALGTPRRRGAAGGRARPPISPPARRLDAAAAGS